MKVTKYIFTGDGMGLKILKFFSLVLTSLVVGTLNYVGSEVATMLVYSAPPDKVFIRIFGLIFPLFILMIYMSSVKVSEKLVAFAVTFGAIPVLVFGFIRHFEFYGIFSFIQSLVLSYICFKVAKYFQKKSVNKV
jgi:hypothetical protein